MIQTSPDAGGVYTFERRVGGKDLGFLALWFVLLGYFAVLWANITAVPLFVRFFLGNAFQFGFHYRIFDCDDLKGVNDRNGHDKGDEYLKAASSLICSVFKRSPVFRIGGDEFAALLMKEDYVRRAELMDLFFQECRNTSCAAEHEWEQVCVSVGIAAYDPGTDANVFETAHRADKLMYGNKRARKEQNIRQSHSIRTAS